MTYCCRSFKAAQINVWFRTGLFLVSGSALWNNTNLLLISGMYCDEPKGGGQEGWLVVVQQRYMIFTNSKNYTEVQFYKYSESEWVVFCSLVHSAHYPCCLSVLLDGPLPLHASQRTNPREIRKMQNNHKSRQYLFIYRSCTYLNV